MLPLSSLGALGLVPLVEVTLAHLGMEVPLASAAPALTVSAVVMRAVGRVAAPMAEATEAAAAVV